MFDHTPMTLKTHLLDLEKQVRGNELRELRSEKEPGRTRIGFAVVVLACAAFAVVNGGFI